MDIVNPPAASSYTPPANYVDRTLLPKSVTGMGRVRLGMANNTPANFSINVYGHSEPMGQGAGTADSIGGLTVGASKYSLAAQLAIALRQRGFSTRRSSWFGSVLSGGTTQTFNDLLAYDTRITRNAGSFSFDNGASGIGCIGGSMIRASTAAGTLTTTFEESFNTATVYSANFSGGGSFTIDVAGGTATTVNTNTAASMLATTVTAAAAGVQAINLKPTVLGTANAGNYFVGLEAYSSTAAEIRIRTMCTSGMQSSRLVDATSPYSYGPALTQIGGDLTIIVCMRNDQFAQVAPATTQANLITAGNRAKAFGDVIFLIDHEPNPTSWNAPNFATNNASYIAAVTNAAASVGAALINIPALVGSGVYCQANGFLGTDGIHFGFTGQPNYAGALAAIIAGLA